MPPFLHSPTGLIHVIAAMAAMGFGTAIVLLPKATRTHKRIGYAYVASMVVVNVTAFGIYVLFKKFGPFHFAAVWSSASIAAGMIPVLRRRPGNGTWLRQHYYFMNWSVVGLYAAFWAETLVRLFPMKQFWPVVVIATLGTTFVGGWLINKNQKRLTGTATRSTSASAQSIL